MIKNRFHFNILVNNIKLNNKKECTINYLKVQVKGKRYMMIGNKGNCMPRFMMIHLCLLK
jgi:hypothetical protein